jgi:hypothetical protein
MRIKLKGHWDQHIKYTQLFKIQFQFLTMKIHSPSLYASPTTTGIGGAYDWRKEYIKHILKYYKTEMSKF